MVRDAEAHATDDQARRDLIDARNQADTLAYAAEKTVNESRDRLPANDVARIETAIAAVRAAAKGEELDAIRRASDELQKLSHGIAEQLYKQSQNDRAHASAPRPQDDNVRDGEVVDA
jgi:molecular chaperone DnaK